MSAANLAQLEDQRAQLVRFIEQCSPQGSSNNRVTIVFDGKMDIFGGMSSSAAKIIFSQGESADDKIKNIVSQTKNTKNIVVVSDDRDIQYAVRALGAKVSGVKAFLTKTRVFKGKKSADQHSSKQVNKNSSVSEKYISSSDEIKITSEFKKIWLKPNNNCDHG